jgi:5-formyltetrahydrofolate cyclo-ligase
MLKAELRKVYKTKRAQLAQIELERCSAEIAGHLFSFIDWRNKKVSLFLPIERLKEINTFPILHGLSDLGATILLSKTNFETNGMELFVFENEQLIQINKWGIPEPIGGEKFNPKEVDVVILPLLISNEKGYRVGYGKGFYDRFLIECKSDVLKVGINFFDELVEIDDINVFDIPLDILITPENIHYFKNL